MEIRPILSALMRSKVSMILVQVALTTRVCVLFIIGRLTAWIDSGVNEADTFTFSSSGFGEGFDARAVMKSDLGHAADSGAPPSPPPTRPHERWWRGQVSVQAGSKDLDGEHRVLPGE
jgi:hypothetical protein